MLHIPQKSSTFASQFPNALFDLLLMEKQTTIDMICIILAVILLVCLFPWPYEWYLFVRFLTMVVMAYLTYQFYARGQMRRAVVAAVVALLFQPFIKLNLGRELWQIADVLLALGLIGNVVYTHGHQPQEAEPAMQEPKKGNFGGYDVFISYAKKDYFDAHGNVIPNNVILRVQHALSAAGISYWIDNKRLVGGTSFPVEIAQQIHDAKVFVYVSSANSNASMWTMNEIATAQSYGKTIIPLRADSTPYAPAIMIYIAGIHYIDYAMNHTRALAQLVEAVKRMV